MYPLRVGAAAMAAVLFGCSNGSRQGGGRADSALPVLPSTTPGSKTDCLTTGLWAECSVLTRLEQAGLVVHADSLSDIRERPLTIAGKRMPIAHGAIALFIYADTGSRSRDQARLDPTLFIAPSAQPSILKQRTLIANQNLLAMLDVANEANRDRIANALMAGPPQPPRRP